MAKHSIICYMDKVDFDEELGYAAGGERIYPSEADLRKHRPCVKGCGVVKVEVVLKEVIQETDFSQSIKRAKPRKDWTQAEKEALRTKSRKHKINTAALSLLYLTKEERLEAVKLAESIQKEKNNDRT